MIAASSSTIQDWASELGGVGLFIIALLDSSFLSFPQVNDLLIIVLSTKYPARMPYYAGMTTLGSLIGCFMLYGVARRGGEVVPAQAAQGPLRRSRAEAVSDVTGCWRWWCRRCCRRRCRSRCSCCWPARRRCRRGASALAVVDRPRHPVFWPGLSRRVVWRAGRRLHEGVRRADRHRPRRCSAVVSPASSVLRCAESADA